MPERWIDKVAQIFAHRELVAGPRVRQQRDSAPDKSGRLERYRSPSSQFQPLRNNGLKT
jgi:hypothetical protein